jgi:uncharacterized LabA/DUF88 family protein
MVRAASAANRPTASIYVDGLNLYRQKLVWHPSSKWLDLVKLAELMLPTHEIVRVRYFSAKVKAPATDPNAPNRQLIYWRALRTFEPVLTLHEGTMRVDKRKLVSFPRKYLADGSPVLSRVLKIEEKGSDVSLASHMVLDAATDPSDLHVLVSSDSDFEPTLSILRKDLGISTGLFSPIEKPAGSLLATDPLIVKVIRKAFLLNSQLPVQLSDEHGVITRPDSWA